MRGSPRHALVLVLALLPAGVPPGRAMTPDEARRYGHSDGFAREAGTELPRTPAPSDAFDPGRIPSPALPRVAPVEQGIPKPSVVGGQLSPLPVLKPAPGAVPPAPAALPPPRGPAGPQRVGDAACLACHPGFEKTPKRGHASLLANAPRFRGRKAVDAVEGADVARAGCESCHGPGSYHVATRSKDQIFGFRSASVADVNRVCLECHYMKRTISPERWRFSRHAASRVPCTACHSEHAVAAPRMLRDRPNDLCLRCHRNVTAQFAQRSHHPVKSEQFDPFASSLQRSKLRCVDCHDPHVRRDEGRRVRMGRDEGCVRCHPRQRGPFLYEHRVSLEPGRGCQECHRPHGSPLTGLLVAGGRALCMRCHADRAVHNPGQTCFTAGCHRDVHGSNHDALLRR